MRRTQLFLVVGVAVASVVLAAEKTVTLEGTLVDSRCYLKDNSLTGNDHGPINECGKLCLKTGTPAGLVTPNKQFFIIVAPSVFLAPYAGQTIRVKGTIYKGSIRADRVEVSREGKWEEVKLGAMM